MSEIDSITTFETADTIMYRSVDLSSTLQEENDSWLLGMEGSARQGSLYDNSGILTIIVVMFLMISLNFKDTCKLFGRFIENLRSDKKRNNAFDEPSNHETRLTILTIIQFLVYGGILLSGMSMIIHHADDSYIDNFGCIIKGIALLASYYAFEYVVYGITGYTFAGVEGSRRWYRALNATQSLAGIFLMLPALLIIFYPGSAVFAVILGAIIYFIARIIFIAKGFSIFYKNIFSSLYFILYLCTLEIIPLIYVFQLALLI